MTAELKDPPRRNHKYLAQIEGQGGAALFTQEALVPAHLLDGGEIVIFAVKPSAWFIVLTSLRWIVVGIALAVLANTDFVPGASSWYLWHLGFWLAVGRLAWATLEWASRLYVLTNRRVMRLRGVFNVELFECHLHRIQNTYLTFSIGERLTRIGTITFQTAAGISSGASWLCVARPFELHEQLRAAIDQTGRRGNNGL